jgi:hypothetical protein
VTSLEKVVGIGLAVGCKVGRASRMEILEIGKKLAPGSASRIHARLGGCSSPPCASFNHVHSTLHLRAWEGGKYTHDPESGLSLPTSLPTRFGGGIVSGEDILAVQVFPNVVSDVGSARKELANE